MRGYDHEHSHAEQRDDHPRAGTPLAESKRPSAQTASRLSAILNASTIDHDTMRYDSSTAVRTGKTLVSELIPRGSVVDNPTSKRAWPRLILDACRPNQTRIASATAEATNDNAVLDPGRGVPNTWIATVATAFASAAATPYAQTSASVGRPNRRTRRYERPSNSKSKMAFGLM